MDGKLGLIWRSPRLFLLRGRISAFIGFIELYILLYFTNDCIRDIIDGSVRFFFLFPVVTYHVRLISDRNFVTCSSYSLRISCLSSRRWLSSFDLLPLIWLYFALQQTSLRCIVYRCLFVVGLCKFPPVLLTTTKLIVFRNSHCGDRYTTRKL